MAQAEDPEKTEAPYSFQRRLLTSKGEDLYLKNYEKYSFHFYKSWKNVDDILTKLDRLSTESDSESCINLREWLKKCKKNMKMITLTLWYFLKDKELKIVFNN